MKLNSMSNGHRDIHETIASLSQAAKKKTYDWKKQVANQYSDAKDAWEDLDAQARKHPWKIIAKAAAFGAAAGFCLGLLKRK